MKIKEVYLGIETEKMQFSKCLKDGPTDAVMPENEALFVLYFDPYPIESDEVKIVTSFIKLVYLKSADTEVVLSNINDA